MRPITSLLLCALLMSGCSSGGQSLTSQPTPHPTSTPAVQGVEVFTGLAHTHLAKGQYPQTYPQSPPVGGPHSPVWLACGVYSQAVPKENAVHSMEHGGIWVTYSPDLPAASVAALGQLATLSPEYVLVSPYSGQNSPVIATTWGLQLRLTAVDDPRLVAFIKAYAGGDQGNEQGVGCARGGVTPAQALQYDRSQR